MNLSESLTVYKIQNDKYTDKVFICVSKNNYIIYRTCHDVIVFFTAQKRHTSIRKSVEKF